MKMRQFRYVSVLLVLISVAACSSDEKTPYVERPVNALYNRAVNALQAGAYQDAARFFEEVERQHPYSVWATKAQLMAAYSNYEASKYDDAIIGLDRFIQLHPGNRDTPYAYYLKGLTFYEQITDVSRDQLGTEKALKALREVIRRYPRSKYARDARLKIDLTRDHLAGKEMSIGRFYLRKKEYIAAINRFRSVIDNYQTTTHIPEALHRVAEAYEAIGMTDEAKKAASVLGHNYPGSEWYIDSYSLMTGKDVREPKEKKGFFARTWNRIF
ncbi:MAG: outer membrane protein assembly factor BamD [Alphaproteobacteria bacterium]|nr:outer membrane protein assembly factor BamD [Alphaproteobacteria bacterium]